jgi:phosphopantothenoylcysteine decarboxylase/phosphopantothenate--cysteine ligase
MPPADVLTGKLVVLGVSGSIAAYKAIALTSELVKAGALVDVVLTPAATRFVQPLSFAAISHRPVLADLFGDPERPIPHVQLGVGAAAFVVAPATADCIAGLALGLGHDALLATALSTRAPLVIAPAMETLMLEHPATQANVETLRRRGAIVVEGESGRLASGRSGRGRLAEPTAILAALRSLLAPRQDLSGRRIVVTAGGTQEAIDPVRFIGNRSTGKMGYALARAARERGAEVVLVSGPTAIAPPEGVDLRRVVSARDMEAAIHAAIVGADAIVMAAAVSDYRVERPAEQKIKRTPDDLVLRLIPNPDIIGGLKDVPLIKVGFAAETNDVVANAQSKYARKGLDLIVANDVTAPGSGFGTDTNQVTLIDARSVEPLPLMAKREVADRVLDRVVRLLAERPPLRHNSPS